MSIENKHINHVEESIIDGGSKGIRNAIVQLNTIYNTLQGSAKKPARIGVKIDGSPSIVCGWNEGEFFVGTKSVWNKKPLLNYDEDDIDKNHENEELRQILKNALSQLPKVIKAGVYQGDVLYTQETLKIEPIDGITYLTFAPNTLTYAIEANTYIGRKIFDSVLGIVFHTRYESLGAKASYDVTMAEFNQSDDVWFTTAEIPDISGKGTLTAQESVLFRELMVNMIRVYKQSNPRFYDMLAQNEDLGSILKMYINFNIRKSVDIRNTPDIVADFYKYIDTKYEKLKGSYKTQKKIGSVHNEKELLHRAIENYTVSFNGLFELHNLMTQAKEILLTKFNSLDHMKAFIKDGDEYRVTSPEGFVVSDHVGNVVKIVDRLNFSYENFKKNTK